MVESPSIRRMLPEGTPPAEVTWTVKVTGWRKFDGLGDAVRVVVVGLVVELLCTACENSDVLPVSSVAVAVMTLPAVDTGKLTEKLASDVRGSVVTVVEPR